VTYLIAATLRATTHEPHPTLGTALEAEALHTGRTCRMR
jgi:hypothetical protein